MGNWSEQQEAKKGWQQLYENLEKIQIGYERIPGFFRNGL